MWTEHVFELDTAPREMTTVSDQRYIFVHVSTRWKRADYSLVRLLYQTLIHT